MYWRFSKPYFDAVFPGYIENLLPALLSKLFWLTFYLILLLFLCLFFSASFCRLNAKVLRGEDETLPIWPEFLNRKDLSNTKKALDDVQKELLREISLVRKMFLNATNMITLAQEGRKETFRMSRWSLITCARK